MQPRILLDGEQFTYGYELVDIVAGELSFHPEDLPMVHAHYHAQIDTIQYQALNDAIGADIYRYIVYILKFLELMSAQLGLRSLTDSVILGHSAWLEAVGKSEAAAKVAKAQISEASDDVAMKQIVDGFHTVLSEALA